MATTEETVLFLTDGAAAKIRQLMDAEPEGESGVLRIAIQGGGCSGFSYGLGLDTAPLEDDIAFETKGVAIVVDPFSAPYLRGATIDLVGEGAEEAFTIDNPNAVSGCGCGSSYEGEGEHEAGPGHGGCGNGCGC